MSFRVDVVKVSIGWGMQVIEQVEFDNRGMALDFIEELNKDIPAYGLPNRYLMARGPFFKEPELSVV